jgi:cytochrome c556
MLKGFPKKLNDLLQMTRDETRFSVDAFKEEIQKLLHESRSLITEVAA